MNSEPRTFLRRHVLQLSALASLGTAVGVTLGAESAEPAAVADQGPAAAVRLAYFPNLTHAPALAGIRKGFFTAALGTTELSTQLFNAGPAAIEAVNAGEIDIAYVGPIPAVNSFARSNGASLRLVAGAATGGAQFVVRDGIEQPGDVLGKVFASPQLGGTQDVALRNWLMDHGFTAPIDGSGTVTVNPMHNGQALALFRAGEIDGAWVPEPWASRLVLEEGAHVLVDERDLWPGRTFPTTAVIVRRGFLERHRESVASFLEGHAKAVEYLRSSKPERGALLNAALIEATGQGLEEAVIERALNQLGFTTDPVASAYPSLVAAGVRAGTSVKTDVDGLIDLTVLNSIPAEKGGTP